MRAKTLLNKLAAMVRGPRRPMKRAWDRNLSARDRGRVKRELMGFVRQPPANAIERRRVLDRTAELLGMGEPS